MALLVSPNTVANTTFAKAVLANILNARNSVVLASGLATVKHLETRQTSGRGRRRNSPRVWIRTRQKRA